LCGAEYYLCGRRGANKFILANLERPARRLSPLRITTLVPLAKPLFDAGDIAHGAARSTR
jgi:hypothetical protein